MERREKEGEEDEREREESEKEREVSKQATHRRVWGRSLVLPKLDETVRETLVVSSTTPKRQGTVVLNKINIRYHIRNEPYVCNKLPAS